MKTSKSKATGPSSKKEAKNSATSTKSTPKETFMKKLMSCCKTYDYQDETKDLEGKARRLKAIHDINLMMRD